MYGIGTTPADRIARARGAHDDVGSVGSETSAIFGRAEAQPIAGAVNLEESVRNRSRGGGSGTRAGGMIGFVGGEDEIGKVIGNVGAGDARENGGVVDGMGPLGMGRRSFTPKAKRRRYGVCGSRGAIVGLEG